MCSPVEKRRMGCLCCLVLLKKSHADSCPAGRAKRVRVATGWGAAEGRDLWLGAPPQACPGRTTWLQLCARPPGRTAQASTAASGTFTSTASCRTSGRCPCRPASCPAVSRATRRCVPTARASLAPSPASPASARKDGRGPSVTRGPMTPVLEISESGLLGS